MQSSGRTSFWLSALQLSILVFNYIRRALCTLRMLIHSRSTVISFNLVEIYFEQLNSSFLFHFSFLTIVHVLNVDLKSKIKMLMKEMIVFIYKCLFAFTIFHFSYLLLFYLQGNVPVFDSKYNVMKSKKYQSRKPLETNKDDK